MVNRTRSNVRRSCHHGRRIDSVHRADDKSFIEGRVEYTNDATGQLIHQRIETFLDFLASTL
jgi:hypothetical protein